MATTQVTVFTAERMAQIEAETIVDARIDGDDLILTTREGTDINIGSIRGPQGDVGPGGSMTGPASSQNDSLALFSGESGTVLKEGQLTEYQVDRQLRNAKVGWNKYAGDAINFDNTNGVLINNPASLRVTRGNNTTVHVFGGVGILSKTKLNVLNDEDHLFGVIEPAITGGTVATFSISASTPPTTYRRDIVAAEFSQSGEIVIRYLTGVGNNTSFGSAPLPTLAANQRILSQLNITNGQLLSASDMSDGRILIPSGVVYGQSIPATWPVAKNGQLVYDLVSKRLLIADNNNGTLRPPWNLPWGRVATLNLTSAAQAITTAAMTDVAGAAISADVIQGRRYSVYYKVGGSLAAAGSASVRLTTASGTELDAQSIITGGLGMVGWTTGKIDHVPASTLSQGFKLRMKGESGTIDVYASSIAPVTIHVDDVGPA